MTLHAPQTEEQSPLLPQTHGADAEVAGSNVSARSRNGATPRSRRAPDYRQRGLDLDAQGLAEAPPRPVRNRHPSLRRRRQRLLIQWAVVLTVTALVVVLLRGSVVQPYSVSSTSMVPTLQAGTDVLVVKSHRLTGPIHVGDIVVLHRPDSARCGAGGEISRDLVKRVIGLPGETIWSIGGNIYVDGRHFNEPGWYNPPFGELGPTKIKRTEIPQGSFFVMGDNRTDSCDSRSFGPIAGSQLVGKAVATITRNGHLFVHSL